MILLRHNNMNTRETDIILLLKLYFLNRHNNYINYMQGFNLLRKWILGDDNDNSNDKPSQQLQTRSYQDIPCPILCSSCFRVCGICYGGQLTLSCSSCAGTSNLAYEIQRICIELDISLDYCVYCICSSISEIYIERNDIKVQLQIAYPRGQQR